jgi:NifU-like protein involved in Fe-S cluster formation
MSEHLCNISRADAGECIEAFEARLREQSADRYDEKDPMSALLTVRRFPMRMKCATLPWFAMRDLLAR